MRERTARVVVCAPHAAVSAGIAATLASSSGPDPRISVVAQLRELAELGRCVSALRPDLVVLQHDPSRRLPAVPLERTVPVVLGLIEDDGGATVLRVLRQGAAAVVAIDSDLEALPRACREVVSGSTYLSPALVESLVHHIAKGSRGARARFELTAQEENVLRRLALGQSASEIARDLKVATRTVRHHLANIYRKLDARSATEAVGRAYREGLVA